MYRCIRCHDAMHLHPAWPQRRLTASALQKSPASRLLAQRKYRTRLSVCSAAAAAAGQVQKRSRGADDGDGDQKEFSDYKVLCYSAQKYVMDTMEDTLRGTFPNISFVEVRIVLVVTSRHGEDGSIIPVESNDISCLSIMIPRLAQASLDRDTAALAKDCDAVILFVNDDCSTEVCETVWCYA